MNKKKTSIYLDAQDHESIAVIQQHYHLSSESAAIRLALSLISKEIENKQKEQEKKRG